MKGSFSSFYSNSTNSSDNSNSSNNSKNSPTKSKYSIPHIQLKQMIKNINDTSNTPTTNPILTLFYYSYPIKTFKEDQKETIILENKLFISFKNDYKIYIYSNNKYSYDFEGYLIGHTNDIWSICSKKSKIIEDSSKIEILSAGDDSNIIIWDIINYQSISIISSGHSKGITKVIYTSNERIFSCSWDSTIKVFDDDCNTLSTLYGHTDSISSLLELNNKSNLMISCGYDGILRYWDINTLICLNNYTIKGVFCNISKSVLYLENKEWIIIGGIGEILIIDNKKHKIIRRVEFSESMPKEAIVGCIIELNNGYFIVGMDDIFTSLMLFDSNLNYIENIEYPFCKGIWNIINSKGNCFISGDEEGNLVEWEY